MPTVGCPDIGRSLRSARDRSGRCRFVPAPRGAGMRDGGRMPPLAKARSPNVAGMRAAGLSPAGAIPDGIGMGTSDNPHNFFTTL